MPWLVSVVVSTEPATGSLKLGQPVPLSNFFFEVNSGCGKSAVALLVIQRATAGRFGAVLAHDFVLLGREQLAPLGVGVRHRIGLVIHDMSAPFGRYLIASGLTGEPTAPVIGMAGATNMNS